MKYKGSCHCGTVQYEVEAEIKEVMSCNCSMCSRKGYLLTFVPAESFTLHSGQEHLQDYQFNKKMIHHYFCKQCGITSFAKGSDGTQEMIAINVRCLENFDYTQIPQKKIDGKNI